MTENPPPTAARSNPEPDRFEVPIFLVALGLYIIERFLGFAFLQSRAAGNPGIESQLLDFFFGTPPFSILNVLLGFGPPEGLLGLLNPRIILQAVLQTALFLVNVWIVGLPFRLYLKIKYRRKEE